jgi:hypothetical protein
MTKYQSDVILHFQHLCFHLARKTKQKIGFEIILISVAYVHMKLRYTTAGKYSLPADMLWLSSMTKTNLRYGTQY